ncbi:MAG: cation transporter [Bdellovibrio sp.]|nr:MAG: cation transporter [Bdellovibrio sp.]
MKNCCENKAAELKILRESQLGVLKTVLWINAIMFVIEIVTGTLSHSTALSADSLDMLGDATVYGFSIYAIHKGHSWKIKAARLKGFIMALFGIGVMAGALERMISGTIPIAETMGIVGVVALAANLVCLMLLWRHRADDINMRSTWTCSRNDIIANAGVLVASALVKTTHSGWPDFAVGTVIAVIFSTSAVGVLRDAGLPKQATDSTI